MNKSSRAGASGHWLRDLLLLTLLTGILFGYELGNRALWEPDEGRYSEIPREMVKNGDYVTPRLNGVKYFEKPVLFYWLQAGAIKLFGVNEWSLRMWTAIFAVLGCLAVYVAGRKLYGRLTGWLAGGVLASTSLYDFMGSVITLDMAVSVFLTMALLSFMLGVREPPGAARRAWLWAFYALAALATMTKGLIGIVIPGMVIGAWIVLLGEWRLLRSIYLPSGIVLFFAIAAPWHVLAARANPEFLHFYFIHEHFERYLTTAHQRYEPVWFFVPVLIAGMYPWSVFLYSAFKDALRGAWRGRRQHREIWFLVLWAGLVFAFFSASKSKLIPYIIPVVPPLALLLARFFGRAWQQPALLGRRRIFWLLLIIGVGLGLALLIIPYFLPEHSRVLATANLLGDRFYVVVIGLLLSGVLPFAFSRSSDARRAFVALLAASLLMLTAVDISLSKLDANRSVKPLALMLKARLQPGDEVATYHQYHQDLPVYLQQRVTIVGWKGELEFGTQVEDTSAWIIDDDVFAQRLRSGTVYILTDESNLDELHQRSSVPIYSIARYGRSVLLTNRKPAP